MKTSQSSGVFSVNGIVNVTTIKQVKSSISKNSSDTLQSSNDPAGLFLDRLVPSIPTIPHNSTPAVDTHRSDADVWNLNQLHKANNCNNCHHLSTYQCEEHGYKKPFDEIDCEQWEYRGKKA